jgi:transcriptional regulator with PAS, ATPase and Fis domain
MRFQSDAILRALKANHGSRTRAAKALGLSYRTLLSKLKEIKGTLSL